jgi:hypothetical protein
MATFYGHYHQETQRVATAVVSADRQRNCVEEYEEIVRQKKNLYTKP